MPGLFDVSQEIILVTGASQGLGRQFARVLSAHGAAVALAARQTAKLKSLEDEILGQGGRAVAVQMDVTDTASIAQAMTGPLVVVNKSTVPPLTGDMVSKVLRQHNTKYETWVVSNPEFLSEGSAIQDFMHPDRVVVGSHDRGAARPDCSIYTPPGRIAARSIEPLHAIGMSLGLGAVGPIDSLVCDWLRGRLSQIVELALRKGREHAIWKPLQIVLEIGGIAARRN